MRNIYLVGFMGTGKTAVGTKLAQKLQRVFVEMDEEIEKREQRPIAAVFAAEGEAYFRRQEAVLLKELSLLQDIVVSCGGGVVIDPHNIQVMNSSGVSLCLKADPAVIFERVRHSSHRPLLQVPDPLQKIKTLLAEREPYYNQAGFSIDTSDKTIDEVVAAAAAYIQTRGVTGS